MAIDMGSIGALITSVKTAAEITQGMIGLRDAAVLQSKVIELNGVILSAQSSALTAQSDQFALLQRIRELEAKVAEMEAWDTEKQRYQLADIGLGSFAYVLKPDTQGTEPPHAICVNCYQRHKKSVLQPDHERRAYILRCNECHALLRIKEASTGGTVQLSRS